MNPKLKIRSGLFALVLLFGRYPISWLLSRRNAPELVPQNHKENFGRYISSPSGNTFYVKIEGSKDLPALVLIHGINSCSQQWQHQQAHLRERYQLVLIDLPGHGRSGAAADLSITTLSRDVSGILKALNIQRPVLYGHSLGGMIIQQYSMLNLSPAPKAIILQSCSFTNPLKTMPIGPLPWLLQRPLISPLLRHIARHNKLFTAGGYLAYTSGFSCLLYRQLLFSGRQSASTLRRMSRFAAFTSAETTAETLLKTFEFKADNKLSKINIPCLVIAARADRLVDPAASRRLQKIIPGSDFALVDGGHQTLVEFPEQTNDAIKQFLDQHQ